MSDDLVMNDGPHRNEWQERLHMLDALVIAVEHRTEVVDIVGSSPDMEAAQSAISEQFGLDDGQARAVLDLQVRRFAELQRHHIIEERDQIIARLDLDSSG